MRSITGSARSVAAWPLGLALLAAQGCPSPAFAQEQTVESAQRFITQMLSGVKLWGTSPRGSFEYSINKVEILKTCVSKAIGTENGFDGERIGYLRFGDITSIRHVGYNVAYRFRGIADTQSYLSFNSESDAARVAYALEFLRLKCDTTAATGF